MSYLCAMCTSKILHIYICMYVYIYMYIYIYRNICLFVRSIYLLIVT